MNASDLHDEPDIAWVAAQRPAPIRRDEASTLRVRAALLEEIGRTGERPPRRRPRVLRLAVRAVAAGGIAVGVVLATGGPDVTTTGAGSGAVSRLHLGGGVPAAAAAPLVRLSNHLHVKAAAAATLTGDATLIVRHQRYPNRGPVDGADLFTDAGTYFYADSAAQLPTAIAAQRADTNPRDDNTWIGRDVKAAESAFDGSIADARQRMANAAYEPGADLKQLRADADVTRAQKIKAAGGNVHATPPLSAKEQVDSQIWSNSMDALNAGAARPAVRAGVLHLLATIDAVTVTQTTENGRDVLVLTAVFNDYPERLTVDAGTGMPVSYHGGRPGTAPSVSVTYDVSRVTLADIAHGG